MVAHPCIHAYFVCPFGCQAPWDPRKAELANKVDDSGRGCVVLGTWLAADDTPETAPCSIQRQGAIKNGLMAHFDMPHRAWRVSWVGSRKSNPQRGTGGPAGPLPSVIPGIRHAPSDVIEGNSVLPLNHQ